MGGIRCVTYEVTDDIESWFISLLSDAAKTEFEVHASKEGGRTYKGKSKNPKEAILDCLFSIDEHIAKLNDLKGRLILESPEILKSAAK